MGYRKPVAALSYCVLVGLILFACRSPSELLASDRNGTITLGEVQQAAFYLKLGELTYSDELRLARDLALVRELNLRSQAQRLEEREAVRYLLNRYLPLRLQMKQALDRQVAAALQEGVTVIRSRALTLKLTQEEILSGSPVSETKIKQIYREVSAGRMEFAAALEQYGQSSDFQELPLAMFPRVLQEVLTRCPQQEPALGEPVDVGSAWILVQCDGWRKIDPRDLKRLLPDSNLPNRELILEAEKERLRSLLAERFSVKQSLPRDWQQQAVLFHEEGVALTLRDFIEEIRFEAWRRNIRPQALLARHSFIEQLFRESVMRLRLAATEKEPLDDGLLAFERRALLARVALFLMLVESDVRQKVLDPLKTGFSEAGNSSGPIREFENQILREIGFRFAQEKR